MYVIKISLALLCATTVLSANFEPSFATQLYSYARPAYCKAEVLRQWQCEPCQQHPRIQELQVFYNDTHAGQGYCAYDPDVNAIIVAVRGTEEFKNWVQDADFAKTDYGCNGCKVHLGFHKVYEDLANNLLACVYTLHSNHPTAQVYVTGHSLGAAVSTFAALEINQRITKVNVFYNFGQPRVGNAAFKTYIESQLSHLFIARITHSKDPFLHLPTQEQGFTHFGKEIYYNPDSSTFQVCSDEDKKCADQYFWPWQWVIKDHLFYFETCAGCGASTCDQYL